MTEFRIIWLKLIKLSWKEKVSSVHIIFIYLKIKLIVDLFPLKSYFNFYFNNSKFDNDNLQRFTNDLRLLKGIKKVIPWNVTCLMECMTIHKYFRKYNLNIPIHVGIKNERSLSAHAWFGELNDIGKYQKIQSK